MFESLIGIHEEFIQEVNALSDQHINKKPSVDAWSVAQVIRHLTMIEEIILPKLKEAIKKEDREIPKKNFHTVILDRTNKVKSSFEPSATYVSKEDILYSFQAVRTSLFEFIHTHPSTDLEHKPVEHPVFGTISIKQMIEFIFLHEKRHLEQIREIKAHLAS